ncbi:hypothetical protein N431DRAFT_171329 [Stipitochalara longipes BDJ]|nr:hypothetical protein N431DRAFT_171329 [Stipitochalara longipes BDJ]
MAFGSHLHLQLRLHLSCSGTRTWTATACRVGSPAVQSPGARGPSTRGFHLASKLPSFSNARKGFDRNARITHWPQRSFPRSSSPPHISPRPRPHSPSPSPSPSLSLPFLSPPLTNNSPSMHPAQRIPSFHAVLMI